MAKSAFFVKTHPLCCTFFPKKCRLKKCLKTFKLLSPTLNPLIGREGKKVFAFLVYFSKYYIKTCLEYKGTLKLYILHSDTSCVWEWKNFHYICRKKLVFLMNIWTWAGVWLYHLVTCVQNTKVVWIIEFFFIWGRRRWKPQYYHIFVTWLDQ